MKRIYIKKEYLVFIFRFAISFCVLYFGSLAVIGLTAPGGYYSSIIANYFDFIGWLRSSYLHTSKFILSALNYDAVIWDKYTLIIKHSNGIRMVYSCIGYGIMSFWGAFIFANEASKKKKIVWLISGLLLIWFINTLRITLLLISGYKHWPIAFGIDHHLLFDIIAYAFIFFMIFLFDKFSHKHSDVSDIPKYS